LRISNGHLKIFIDQMSLFGGDTSEPQTSQSEDGSFPSSPNFPASGELPSTNAPASQSSHTAQPLSYQTLALEDEDESEQEQEQELDPDEETSRPNRFAGKASTWKGHTVAERQLATSLDQLQAGDLAAHLYNAYALKMRVRRPAEELADVQEWQTKDSWLKKGEDLTFTDVLGDVQTELIPHKRWTAWPLPVNKVPGVEERYGLRESDGGIYGAIGCIGEPRAGEELREEMLALFQRLAKDKLRSRESEGESQDGRESQRKTAQNVKRERSCSAKIDAQQGGTDVEMQEDDNDAESNAAQSGTDTQWAPILGTSKSVHLSQPLARTTLLADDDKARQILRPSINSLLAQLDDTAAAIRRSRLNRFGRGAYVDTSGSEMLSDADGLRSNSRPRSQQRRRSAATSKPGSHAVSHAPSQAKKRQGGEATSKTPGTRQDTDSESASDYGVDTGLDRGSSSNPSRASSTSKQRGWSGTTGSEDSTSVSSRSDIYREPGLIDWSEVLGIASMTGFNEKAVARTAQRCAALFGEGMSFRLFDESLAMKPIPEPIEYTPATIPSPDILDIQGSTAIPKRPYFEPKTLYCPHTDCWSHTKPFAYAYRVVEHIVRVHKYDPRKKETAVGGEMYGGVHRDGFLQPISAKQGWRTQSGKKGVDGGDSDGGALQWKRRKRQNSEPSSPVSSQDWSD
jgi:hypothetical protein